jgi:hypothetical protein
MKNNQQPTKNPQSVPSPLIVSKEPIPFSQCNEQMIKVLDECERKKQVADEMENKKRKVTPTKSQQPLEEQDSYSVASKKKCSYCKNMDECHEIKFSGYCLAKVFVFCEDVDNAKSLDWHMVSYIYKDAYKEILRVCTYLATDLYDPSEEELDLPYCMESASYLEAEELVKCKLALNRVSQRFWNGAMKKAPEEL